MPDGGREFWGFKITGALFQENKNFTIHATDSFLSYGKE